MRFAPSSSGCVEPSHPLDKTFNDPYHVAPKTSSIPYPAMADAVRPDPLAVQQMLQKSRSLWSSYAAASTNCQLPPQCIQLRNILGRVPAFPTRTLESNGKQSLLRYNASDSGLAITGTSTWCTSQGECKLPPITMDRAYHYRWLICGVRSSLCCTLAKSSPFAEWPGVQEVDEQSPAGNHLAILILAWAFILSARWVELQSSGVLGSVHYTGLQASGQNKAGNIDADPIEVDVGGGSKGAARWWASILASGEGWRAWLAIDGKVYRSPWSLTSPPITSSSLRGQLHQAAQTQLPPLSRIVPILLRLLKKLCNICSIIATTMASAASAYLLWQPHCFFPGRRARRTPVWFFLFHDSGVLSRTTNSTTPLLCNPAY